MLLLLTYAPTRLSAQSTNGEDCFNGLDDDLDGLIDLNDGDCDCGNLIVTEIIGDNLINNGGFENSSCGNCPNSAENSVDCLGDWFERSQVSTMQTYFHCPDDPLYSDYASAGNQVFVGGGSGWSMPEQGTPGNNGTEGIVTQLISPIQADSTYRFRMRIEITDLRFEGPVEAAPVRNFAVYGNNNGGNLPGSSLACDGDNLTGWEELGVFAVQYDTSDIWTDVTLTFTSSGDYQYFAFGASCIQTLPNSVENDFYYWYIDDLELRKITRPDGEDPPDATITTNSGACEEELLLEVAEVPDATYQWYRNNLAVPGAIGPSLSLSRDEINNNNYTVLLLTNFNCVKSDPYRLSSVAAFALTDSVQAVSCFGQADGAIFLTAADSVLTYDFQWQDEAGTIVGNTPNLTNLVAGDYELLIVDDEGCEYTYDYRVREPDLLEIEADVLDADCTENTGLGQLFMRPDGGTWPFDYYPNDLPPIRDEELHLPPGDYNVEVVDANGCSTSISGLAIAGYPIFNLRLTSPLPRLNLGESVDLRLLTNRSGPFSVDWSTNEGPLDCPACNTLSVAPTQATWYYVEVRDPSDGCIRIDSLRLPVVPVRPVYVPNAFSPNDDGVNDLFQPSVGPAVTQLSNLRIFNRWGQIVYESAAALPWDGRRGEQKLPSGLYIYQFEARFLDGAAQQYDGSVLLLN
ncbi:MAG: gliding motility-associated C-terminal domain-containing protein [Bacteroidota bacterium]